MPPLEQVLKGRRILLTGSTGFLGKVFLAILLRWHPEIERVYLLIRGDRRSSLGRFRREILDSPVFAPLREHLGEPGSIVTSKKRSSSFPATSPTTACSAKKRSRSSRAASTRSCIARDW